MRLITKLITFLFLLASLNLSTIPSAIAGCQDYPQSVTPECVLENLAIAKLLEEKRKADEVEGQRKADEAARYWAEKSAADRAATTAADNALAPDDCARSTNTFLQRCVDARTEKARVENEAKSAADRAATTAADNALAPDDCARSTNTSLQRCVDARTEKARVENEAVGAVRKSIEMEDLRQSVKKEFFLNGCDEEVNKLLRVCLDAIVEKAAVEKAVDSAAKNAILTRDNTLAADDCARSTNQLLPRCIDNSVKEYIKAQVKIVTVQKIADAQLAGNNCDQKINKILQVCLNAKATKDTAENVAINMAKDLENAQSLLTKPVRDSNGEVILTALRNSKSLSSKDIAIVLSALDLNSSDQKLLNTYARQINSVKSTPSKIVNLPLSDKLAEEFTSATPKICAVVDNFVKTLKSGVCLLNVKFITESGFEIQTTKKITFRR